MLRLYQPEVDDFQVLHCAVPGGHKAELVVDPGPGVLLVVGGEGRAMVRAAAVSDVLAMDEVELQPGEEEGGQRVFVFVLVGECRLRGRHAHMSEMVAQPGWCLHSLQE